LSADPNPDADPVGPIPAEPALVLNDLSRLVNEGEGGCAEKDRPPPMEIDGGLSGMSDGAEGRT
jgi:hypothetical protein